MRNECFVTLGKTYELADSATTHSKNQSDTGRHEERGRERESEIYIPNFQCSYKL